MTHIISLTNPKVEIPIPCYAAVIPKGTPSNPRVVLVEFGPDSNHTKRYGLPGGTPNVVRNNGIIQGVETGIQATVREVFEESGLTVFPSSMYVLDKRYEERMGKNDSVYRGSVILCCQSRGNLNSRMPNEARPFLATLDELEAFERQEDLELNVFDMVKRGISYWRNLS